MLSRNSSNMQGKGPGMTLTNKPVDIKLFEHMEKWIFNQLYLVWPSSQMGPKVSILLPVSQSNKSQFTDTKGHSSGFSMNIKFALPLPRTD